MVESNPPGAPIEVNGNTLCESTPCEIKLECTDKFTAIGHPRQSLVAPYRVVANPVAPGQQVQVKVIEACQLQDGQIGNIRFDFNLKTMPNKHQFEISNGN
jgi:hypothetical protein